MPWKHDSAPERSLPSGLAACRQLTRLDVVSDAASPVLARLHSLQHFNLRMTEGQQQHGRYWKELTGLTELQLHCGMGGGQGTVVLAMLIQ